MTGLLLPCVGYLVGWLASLLFRQKYEDLLAISIEAGIQNIGIAVFILRSALSQPEADLTTVIPVSVAIMTPFPLIAFYLYLKSREWLVVRYKRHCYIIPSDKFLNSLKTKQVESNFAHRKINLTFSGIYVAAKTNFQPK